MLSCHFRRYFCKKRDFQVVNRLQISILTTLNQALLPLSKNNINPVGTLPLNHQKATKPRLLPKNLNLPSVRLSTAVTQNLKDPQIPEIRGTLHDEFRAPVAVVEDEEGAGGGLAGVEREES